MDWCSTRVGSGSYTGITWPSPTKKTCYKKKNQTHPRTTLEVCHNLSVNIIVTLVLSPGWLFQCAIPLKERKGLEFPVELFKRLSLKYSTILGAFPLILLLIPLQLSKLPHSLNYMATPLTPTNSHTLVLHGHWFLKRLLALSWHVFSQNPDWHVHLQMRWYHTQCNPC